MSDFDYALLATRGNVASHLSVETALAHMGENAGNLIFQYAVPKLLAGTPFYISTAEGNYGSLEAQSGHGPLVIPAANHLRNADWSQFCNFLERQSRPVVVLGLGADRDQSAALKTNKSVMRFAAILRERALLVTVRGLRSAEIAEDLGIPAPLPLGCPSIFLNKTADLGQLIFSQLHRFSPRVAIHAADPFNFTNGASVNIEHALMAWAREDEAKLWILPSGGTNACSAASGNLKALSDLALQSFSVTHADGNIQELTEVLTTKSIFPRSAQAWIQRLQHCDLAIGTRVHGALAAIAAGIPGVLIPNDARSRELAQTMHLPSISPDKFILAAQHSLERVRQEISFDAPRFDLWRRQAARSLSLALSRVDLPPSAHLTRIANV